MRNTTDGLSDLPDCAAGKRDRAVPQCGFLLRKAAEMLDLQIV
jgi:hypothetical protein